MDRSLTQVENYTEVLLSNLSFISGISGIYIGISHGILYYIIPTNTAKNLYKKNTINLTKTTLFLPNVSHPATLHLVHPVGRALPIWLLH